MWGVTNSSSALFLLIKRSTPAKVLRGNRAVGAPGPQDILLSHEQEEKLRAAITKAANVG
jgi:uncharacterized membrane protein